MIKLKDILKETPVDTYSTIGDFQKGASFRDKRDRDLVVHPVAIQKVHDFFKNTTVNFDFYFVNLKGLRKFTEKRLVKKEFVFEPYPNGLGIKPEQLKNGSFNENNITVFFIGNSAAEKIPLTAWTIAHRFGHVIRRDYAFEQYFEWLDKQFDELLKVYNVEDYDRKRGHSFIASNRFNKIKANLFNQIGTMKSARDGKIDRYAEFYYELFAQYLKSGKVTFNKLNRNILKGYAAYGRKDLAYTNNVEEANQILSDIERDINYYIEDVLSNCIGNIYVM